MGEGFCSWWNSSRLSSLREVAIVLFIAIAPNTFLREVPLTPCMSSSALAGRRGFIWCEFLTVRATPSKASCELAWMLKPPHPRSTRVGLNGRDLELPGGNSDRTTADESEFLVSPVSFLQMSWSSPSAVALASARRPPRGSMRGQRREGRPLCRAEAVVLLGPVGLCGRKFTALGIRLSFLQHVPDDRGQLSHHGHARDGGAPERARVVPPQRNDPRPATLRRAVVDVNVRPCSSIRKRRLCQHGRIRPFRIL